MQCDRLMLMVGLSFLTLSRCIQDRKSTRLNSSHLVISYAVFCLKKKKTLFNLLKYSLTFSCEHDASHIDEVMNSPGVTKKRVMSIHTTVLPAQSAAKVTTLLQY